MRKLELALVASIAGVAIVACATQPSGSANAQGSSSGSQCFRADQVNGFSSVSDNVIDVNVGANSYYRLTLYGSCGQAAFATGVALRRVGSGSGWICGAADAEIVVPGQVGLGERCLVQSIQPIPKEQWEADRKK